MVSKVGQKVAIMTGEDSHSSKIVRLRDVIMPSTGRRQSFDGSEVVPNVTLRIELMKYYCHFFQKITRLDLYDSPVAYGNWSPFARDEAGNRATACSY